MSGVGAILCLVLTQDISSVPYFDKHHQVCVLYYYKTVTVCLCSDKRHGPCCFQQHFNYSDEVLLGTECTYWYLLLILLRQSESNAAGMLTASNAHGAPK